MKKKDSSRFSSRTRCAKRASIPTKKLNGSTTRCSVTATIPNHMEMLRSGKIEAITSQPPFSDQLEKEGYPMILDPNTVFPRRPGKLTVATGQMIEKRADELRAYFRAIIRAFWFMRDMKNFEYLRDLEKKLRKTNTHNEDERGVVAIVTSPDRLGKLGTAHRWRHRSRGGATNRRRHGEVRQTSATDVGQRYSAGRRRETSLSRSQQPCRP